jgi:hypothetical protein
VRKSLRLTGGLVAIVVSLAVAPSAWASFRLFENSGFGGHEATFNGNDRELNNRYWDGTHTIMQNQASSMDNTSNNRAVGLWDIGSSCTGLNYVAQPGSFDASFSNNGFNDKASCVIFL